VAADEYALPSFELCVFLGSIDSLVQVLLDLAACLSGNVEVPSRLYGRDQCGSDPGLK
jgi:hypothetical protein